MTARAGLLWAVSLLAACGAPQEREAPPARPVTTRADPQPWLPPVADGAGTVGEVAGVVAAGSSLDVVSAALRFIQAIIDEDIEAVLAVTADEVSIGGSGRTVPRQIFRRSFESQFALLDYHQFTLEEVVDRQEVEVQPFDARAPAGGSAPANLQEGDILVRLSMLVTRRNRRRYFEDAYELWFRQTAGRWQIVGWGR